MELTFLRSSRRGEAVDLARDAARGGVEAVIVIGGDGTVNEVVNGLVTASTRRPPALGVIPAGTGNDFAFAAGLTRDVQRAIAIIQQGNTRPVDVGEIRDGAGRSRFWINNVGTLLDGRINLASHRLTWPKGPGRYVRASLQTLMRKPATAHLELCLDEKTHVRDAIMLSIGNGPRSGGKFLLTPDAIIDDGRFDYVLARPMNRLRLLALMPKAMRGTHLQHPCIEHGRFSTLALRSSAPIAVHLDGEPWSKPEDGICEITIKVLPNALRVLCS